MRPTSLIAFAAVTFAATQAWAQLRVVSYNMLDKPSTLTDTTTVGYINTAFGAIASRSVNGIAKRPDVIFLAEQTTNSPANLATILNNLYGVTSYSAVTPTSPQSQGTNDRVAFVYDSSSVTLSSSPVALAITSSYPRPTIRAGFRPVGYSGADADVYVYGMHLKASTGSANEIERANQTLATRADADTLPAGSNIIYAGDFNVYTSNEQGYRNFFAAGGGQAVDPLNASYLANGNPITWNSAAYAGIHTQSTRLVTLADGGATGGLDDRFDYQLMSHGVTDGDGISYIGPSSPDSGSTHSYTAFGNNGNTYNKALIDGSNTAAPANVLNALYNISDHLPIIADYQVPAKMSVATTAATIPSAVIEGAAVSFNVSITNSAAVTAPFAADALDYNASATNTTGAAQLGSVRATLGAAVKTFNLDTSTIGSKVVQVNVTSSSQAVVGGSFATNVPVTVYAHAQPSLNGATEQTAGSIDVGIVAIGSTVSGEFSVYNQNVGGFVADLDLDSATAAGSTAFTYQFVPVANLNAGGSTSISFSFSPTLSQVSNGSLSIQTSDADLLGAIARAALGVSFVARGAYAGDANLSDTVDFDDLLILAQNYSAGNGTWFLGDFNRDQQVNFDDLLALAQNYGLNALGVNAGDFVADWALARSLAPEPTTLAMIFALAPLARRRRSQDGTRINSRSGSV